MNKNIGTTDRIVRFVIAAILIILSITKVLSLVWTIIALIVAGLMILTAVIRFCPLYCPLSLNTNKKGCACGSKSCCSKK